MCVFSLNFSSACFVCAHKIRKIHNSRREFLRLKFKFEMFRLLFMIFKRMKQKKMERKRRKITFCFVKKQQNGKFKTAPTKNDSNLPLSPTIPPPQHAK